LALAGPLALLLSGCAACATRFAPVSAEEALAAERAWEAAAERADAGTSANVLYEATVSQGVLKMDGTLAVRLRAERVDATLAGPFGSPIATYADGELRGEKLRPISLPARQLRALLAGTWTGAAPVVEGRKGGRVRLRWSGEDAAEGIFDLDRGLRSLRVERNDGEIEAKFSDSRNPWPDAIEIREKRTGSKLALRMLSRETAP
jgi:hypothetical protein